MSKINWLDRDICAPGPRVALCLSEDEFQAVRRSMRAPDANPWIKNPQSDATSHYFEHESFGMAVAVCMQGWEGRNPIEVAGLLIHEAVHVWQEYASYIGEANPGAEQEAYAIQKISQELMAEFSRRMGDLFNAGE